ncbi:MAG: T9SS type A sorting domain-containing protein [Candidatus Latescibacteria bacterium]|jgi:hypothetical protein|nr:T9SS type A sorting domain-containing protein [Candidatus Latescibacterota bacterium]
MVLTRIRWIVSLVALSLTICIYNSSANAAISSGFTSAQALEGEIGTGAMIKVRDIFVPSGFDSDDDGIKLPISLLNDSGLLVGGIQFDLDLEDVEQSQIEDIVIDPALGDLGFELRVELQPNSDLRIVIFTLDPQAPGNGYIPSGDLDIAWICFTTPELGNPPSPLTPLGEVDLIKIVPESVIISDDHGVLIGDAWMDGVIQIGILCDANRDGLITVQDVVVWVGSWLFGQPWYEPFPENSEEVMFKIFDGNMDLDLNVADPVAIVNKILGRPIDDGIPTKVTGGAPLIVNLGVPSLQLGGELAVPVLLDADSFVAGGEMVFTFDSDLITVGEPYIDNQTSSLILQSKIEDGVVRLMIISLSGDVGLDTGSSPAVLIPIMLKGDREGVLTLDSAMLVNRLAQELPARLGDYSQAINKSMMAPTSFALKNNAPNPFNPTTTISYEVPQQAHIQLVVYNILGQEVNRLVDEVKTPGRYTAVWDARNTHGQSVSSGIYMYRLSSSTGFSDAKRMTLLK